MFLVAVSGKAKTKDDEEIDALMAELDAPKQAAAPEPSSSKKKKKKGKGGAAPAEEEDLDALLAEFGAPNPAEPPAAAAPVSSSDAAAPSTSAAEPATVPAEVDDADAEEDDADEADEKVRCSWPPALSLRGNTAVIIGPTFGSSDLVAGAEHERGCEEEG